MIYAGFAILAVLLGLILWKVSARPGAPAQSPEQAAELAELRARLDAARGSLEQAETDRGELRRRLDEALAGRSAAETRQTELVQQLEKAEAARQLAEAARGEAEKERIRHEREAALARQQLAEQEKRLADFDQTMKQMTEAAKAATLETGKLLSGQLLENHKRETEAQKKEAEAKVKQTTEGLLQQFTTITDTVSRLHQQVGDSRRTIETVHRALSHPGGAGRLAEIGLENTLKAFGLQPGHDFIIQYHAAGDGERGSLRPDAVVFLPGDAVLVIDSKASKFLLDHAEAEDEAQAEQARSNLARSMNNHMRALASKDYKAAVLDTYHRLRRGGQIRRAILAMALPTDVAVETLRKTDPQIEQRALTEDIILVGPSALSALISFARIDIDLGRQVENHDKIVNLVTKLMDNLAVSLGHVTSINKDFRSAAESLSKFSASINRNVLPQISRLAEQGIRPNKLAPSRMARIAVDVPPDSDIIDAEAEEVPQTPPQLGLDNGRDG